MSALGIRRLVKTSIKKALGMAQGPSDTAPPNWQSRSPETLRPAPEADDHDHHDHHHHDHDHDEPVAAAAPPAEPPAEAATESAAEEAAAEEAAAEEAAAEGGFITMEAVQSVLDDMVRPALQGDGGDIHLIAIEGNDIHVKLVGACGTCPSSIMTMKMGVETLLREEFPAMNELVQV